MRKVVIDTGLVTGADGSAGITKRFDAGSGGKVVGIGVSMIPEVGGDNSIVPATTDVTVRTVGFDLTNRPASPPQRDLLALANNNTGGWYQPRFPVHDVAGAPVASNFEAPVIADQLEVVVAQANTNNRFIVTVLLDG